MIALSASGTAFSVPDFFSPKNKYDFSRDSPASNERNADSHAKLLNLFREFSRVN